MDYEIIKDCKILNITKYDDINIKSYLLLFDFNGLNSWKIWRNKKKIEKMDYLKNYIYDENCFNIKVSSPILSRTNIYSIIHFYTTKKKK